MTSDSIMSASVDPSLGQKSEEGIGILSLRQNLPHTS